MPGRGWLGGLSARAYRLAGWQADRQGFAGVPGLLQPRDWHVLARDAVAKCQGLVDEVVQAPPTAVVVRLLDDMSDTLCQVLDAAEFCRNVHADAEWRQEAQQVCVDLGAYVQQLNTHYGIYSSLVRALKQHDAAAAAAAAAGGGTAVGSSSTASTSAASASATGAAGGQRQYSGFTEEAVLVGRMLQRDFERYGVHLSGEARDHMNTLVHQAQVLGMQFTHNVLDPGQLGSLELTGGLAAAVQHLPHSLRKKFRPLADRSTGALISISCPAETNTLHSLMRCSRDEGLRRAAFTACHTQPAANLAVLDALVQARHEVASLMGYDSYAAYQLDSFSLASHPIAVVAFLERFAADIAPKCQLELAELQRLKQLHAADSSSSNSSGSGSSRSRSGSGGGGGSHAAAAAGAESAQVPPWDRNFLMSAARTGAEADRLNSLPDYFELERVVEGLSELLRQSMGVQLEEQPLAPGEGWAPGVRKLAAIHDTDGFLGVVYLDLYRRPHKFPSAAHFTLRCGRRLADGSYQTPVVALVANMVQHYGMSMSEVETLFHEFGHALNSLLSRTEFQHLSGTRGPLDLVEVPSHTLELFASDPRVLSLFARHRSSGAPLPEALLRQAEASKRRFAALEQQQQLQYCLIDQLLHGPNPPTGQQAVLQVSHIVRQHSALGHAEGCHPHIRFTHLVGYGATYYSYLYAQCLSARIWQEHLAADPTGRDAGELLRHRLLQPGGAKEAHCLIEDLFTDTSTSSSSISSRISSSSSMSSGGSSSSSGDSRGGGGRGLCSVGGGWYPDTSSMLQQQELLVR